MVATEFDRTRSLGYLVHQVARRMGRDLADRLAPHGVAPAQFSVLLELGDTPGLTQRELAARLRVEQPTMANTLARSVRDGLVTSRAHETDRRSCRYRLTAEARRLLPTLEVAAMASNDAALAALSDVQAAQLVQVLQRLAGDG
jgi:DNA-binding MarR family transcriptional regulator